MFRLYDACALLHGEGQQNVNICAETMVCPQYIRKPDVKPVFVDPVVEQKPLPDSTALSDRVLAGTFAER